MHRITSLADIVRPFDKARGNCWSSILNYLMSINIGFTQCKDAYSLRGLEINVPWMFVTPRFNIQAEVIYINHAETIIYPSLHQCSYNGSNKAKSSSWIWS